MRELEPINLSDRSAGCPIHDCVSFSVKVIYFLYAFWIGNGKCIVSRAVIVFRDVMTNSLVYVHKNHHLIMVVVESI